jgi:hypothetical protein
MEVAEFSLFSLILIHPFLRLLKLKSLAPDLVGGLLRCRSVSTTVLQHGAMESRTTRALCVGAAVSLTAWGIFLGVRSLYRRRDYLALVGNYFSLDTFHAFEELDAERGDVSFDRVEEVGGEAHGAGGDAAGGPIPSPGKRVRRKKLVAVPYQGGQLTGAYLAELVAEVRVCNYARAYNPANADIVRSHLRRRMIEHGVRPTHIMRALPGMVLAVFHRNSDDVMEERAVRTATWWGYMRRFSCARY